MRVNQLILSTLLITSSGGLLEAIQESKSPLVKLGTYHTGVFDKGGAEIAAYDRVTKRVFVVNGNTGGIDVLDIQNPKAPTKLFEINLKPFGASANSVAVYQGTVAVAVQSEIKTDPGKVAFFDAEGKALSSVTVGALPDMLTFTPDGSKVLVANEGEPSNDYKIDPEGSVSIIDVSKGYSSLGQGNVRTVNLAEAVKKGSVRITGPNATIAQDLEPEYIAVSKDSRTCWVTLQENNALAKIDLVTGKTLFVRSFGFKDHSKPGNVLGRLDKASGKVVFESHPLFGMYQPDSIAAYSPAGKTFLITANEGDTREYGDFKEEAKVSDLNFNAAEASTREFTVSRFDGVENGVHKKLYSFGARSFSIWNEQGEMVWDSGSDFERITAKLLGPNFNSNNTKNQSGGSRSDKKGPEPEGIAIGVLGSRTIAFIGLERVGGVMVYDVSNPTRPSFLGYVNNRDFSANAKDFKAGDLGPEGLLFIDSVDSPIGKPMLVVANEVSGTTTFYEVNIPTHQVD